MRRIISLLAVLLLCSSVNAQVPMTGAGLAKPATGGGGSPTLTGLTTGANEACGFVTTCPIAGLTVPSGFIVMGVGGRQIGGTVDWSAVDLCGTSLTKVIGNGDVSGYPTDLWAGTVTGGTCTANVTGPAGTVFTVYVGLGLFSNLTSTTATSTCIADNGTTLINGPYTCSSALTVPSSGFGIAFGYSDFSGTGCTFAWTAGVTLDSAFNGAQGCAGIGHTAAAGSATPAFTSGTFLPSGVAGATYH